MLIIAYTEESEGSMANLIGKVLLHSDIRVVTGLLIGSGQSGIKIGGIDSYVITDPEGKPYIPGSSLKGKLRNLLERAKKSDIDSNGVHSCAKKDGLCEVCKIFGVIGITSEKKDITLTRLYVRDVFLDENSISEEMKMNFDRIYTEVKFETAIDRVKGTALHRSLRQIERVPAGAVFRPAEFIFNIYEQTDKDLLRHLFEAMALLEDDYLGGMGSRGYGKVKLENIKIWWNKVKDYENGALERTEGGLINKGWHTPQLLIQNFSELRRMLDGD